jgi:hypothetical protein
MSAHTRLGPAPPLDFSRWRELPNRLLMVGGAVTVLGLLVTLAMGRVSEFGYAWLLGFMMCLSLTLGAMFLVLVHHLFDAGWSVPIRRACEHLACLSAPVMFVLWIPIGLLAVKLYPWMSAELQAHPDHALHAKWPLFTLPGFYFVSIACFVIWYLVAWNLRKWSVEQDQTGAAECTRAMRRWACGGIFLFAVSLSFGAIFWMKALSHVWFSTMYGVYYFAGSVWVTLATVYVITLWLEQQGILRDKLHEHQYYFLGSLFFAFTVFYAYIAFSQYFIIWNANIPEETFWYLLRDAGSWRGLGLLLIFGHFFLPFLALLRIDAKHHFPLMLFMFGWAWVMHFADMAYNILPVAHAEGFPFQWLWLYLGVFAFMAGLLMKLFLLDLGRYAPYPVRDPRLAEALGFRPSASPISGGEMPDTDEIQDRIEGGPLESPGQTPGGAP